MDDLTPLMRGVLEALDVLRDSHDYPSPPSRIALQMGLENDVRRLGNGTGKGAWSGFMNPAQRIIFPLNALRKRDLIYLARRPDGQSGTAYGLTRKGAMELVDD